jgi:hypothetical protein
MAGRKTLKLLYHLSWVEWRLLAEAGVLLVVVRLALWFVPFRRLAARFGKAMEISPSTETEAQRAAVIPIGWAVQVLGERLPWMKQCLVQALAAMWMLQSRRIPCTLYFGLAKDSSGQLKALKAHAWVRSGTQVLTGARGRNEFKVVATFADPRLYEESGQSRIPVDSLQHKETTQ